MLDQRRAGTMFATRPGVRGRARRRGLGRRRSAARPAASRRPTTSRETWAKPLPPLPIEGGTVAGRLEDLQGRFNLNNLVFADGTTNPDGVKQLERILTSLDIEPGWATDDGRLDRRATRSPGFPDGAEDTRVHGPDPALSRRQHADHARQRAPGAAGVRRRALREAEALRDCAARSARRSTSAPRRASCSTRSARTCASSDSIRTTSRSAARTPAFPTLDDLHGSLGDADYDKVKNSLTESSSYFGATVWVTIGTTDFTLYSLLVRGQGGLGAALAAQFRNRMILPRPDV